MISINEILVFARRFEEQVINNSEIPEEENDKPEVWPDQSFAKDKGKGKGKGKGSKWKKMPKGWKSKSRKSYHDSIGGFDGCMKKMKKKMDEPGAFCASLKDRVKGKGWRKKKRKKKK